MKKKILLIFENSEIKHILDSETSNESLIIAGDKAIQEKITNLGYTCKLINDYSKNPKNEIDKAIEWIKKWPDKSVLNGKSFKDILVYDDLSIFWFLENRFYMYKIQSLIPLIEQIKNMINTENPTDIFIKGNRDVYHIINRKYKNLFDNIQFISEEKNYNTISYKSYSGNRFLKLLALKFFRGLKTSKKEDITEPILIITEMSNWRPIFDYEKKKIIHKDFMFHDIIKNLKSSNLSLRIIDYENNPKRLFKSNSLRKEREKAFDVSVEPWEKYITQEIIKKTKKFNHDLEILWEKLKKSEEFKKSLTYEDISLYDILQYDIELVLKNFKTYMSATFIETAKRILDIIKPSVILMHDEYGALQLSIIQEAKKRKIPTVSIQHSANFESHLSYIHLKHHIQDEKNNLNFPIPQKMCVWSEKSKESLIHHGNFPENVPVITGDPRIDFLPNAVKQFTRQNICQKLKIPIKNKIIVFATQPLKNIKEKELHTNSVFKSIKKFDNVFLLIKIHPLEDDLSFYKDIAKKFNVTNYSIQKFFNLYEILYISDVVIISFSTVGSEAMRMKKPVICLNMLGLHNNEPILKSGIPFIINSELELIPAIQNCFKIETIFKKIIDGESFAEKEMGKVDGQASKRITNIITELNNKKF